MPRMFHVSSTRNRASIERHGLDWTRMDAARGIAGSHRPELDGVFVSRTTEDADWFVSMNNTGGPVDVWAVDGIDDAALRTSPNGYEYLPDAVPADALTLLERDLAGNDLLSSYTDDEAGGPYSSTLTITLDDGTVLTDEQARGDRI